ncbi:MAG: hypothetical protein HWD58_07195 [Bacteroidota bacterium]|nr:MAG: hypothetical protein HWD58_07195 [Bacteroidota bacterium]
MNAVEQDVSYQWVRCPDYSSLPGQTNRQFAPTRNGEYAVILTRGICSDTSQCIPVSELGLLESDFSIFRIQLQESSEYDRVIFKRKCQTGL